jgi:CRISPR-associated protein Cas2
MPQCLLLYDIPNDRVRQRVADACLDYGLARIQFSAFAGVLSRTHQRALFVEITQRVGRNGADIQLIVLPDDAWSTRRIIAQEERDRG